MPNRIDLVGRVFGKLTVVSYSHTELNAAFWNCVCECGNTVVVRGKSLKARLKTGGPQGCGCQMRKYPLMGRTDFALYQSWIAERKYKYGVTEEGLRGMMDSQKGCCAVCGKSLINPVYRGHDLCIDHNHETGEVRGLLCLHCNTSLGFALDDPTILSNLKRYLNNGG